MLAVVFAAVGIYIVPPSLTTISSGAPLQPISSIEWTNWTKTGEILLNSETDLVPGFGFVQCSLVLLHNLSKYPKHWHWNVVAYTSHIGNSMTTWLSAPIPNDSKRQGRIDSQWPELILCVSHELLVLETRAAYHHKAVRSEGLLFWAWKTGVINLYVKRIMPTWKQMFQRQVTPVGLLELLMTMST